MRLSAWVAPVLFAAGIASLAVALARGEATLSLVVIFPVITATGAWAVLGILLIVASFVFGFFALTRRIAAPTEGAEVPGAGISRAASERRWGGVVFLGPLPIVFGSDARVTTAMLIVAIIVFAGLLFLTFLLFAL